MIKTDDFYQNNNTTQNSQPLIMLLNQQIKQATTNFNAISHQKNYLTFIEHANYTSNLINEKDFCFQQILDLIRYLNINLFGEKFYLV